MLNKLTPGYPKEISGTVSFSGDSVLDILPIEVAYTSDVSSKNERQVTSVTVSFPSRESGGNSHSFSKDTIIVDYSPGGELYSLTFLSVSSLIDMDTGEFKLLSEVEKHAEDTEDIELIMFIQIGLQFWGSIMDMFPIIDISGNLIKKLIQQADNLEEDAEDE